MGRGMDLSEMKSLLARVDRAVRRHQGLHVSSTETKILQAVLGASLSNQESVANGSAPFTLTLYQPAQAERQLAELRKVLAKGPSGSTTHG